jgi:hypothetical protein
MRDFIIIIENIKKYKNIRQYISADCQDKVDKQWSSSVILGHTGGASQDRTDWRKSGQLDNKQCMFIC